MADAAQMSQDQTVGALNTARGMDADQTEAVVHTEQADELLSDLSSQVAPGVARDLVVRPVRDEELEQGKGDSRGSVVLRRVERNEVGEMVDDDMDADVAFLVGR